jgi:hypothetical protein
MTGILWCFGSIGVMVGVGAWVQYRGKRRTRREFAALVAPLRRSV